MTGAQTNLAGPGGVVSGASDGVFVLVETRRVAGKTIQVPMCIDPDQRVPARCQGTGVTCRTQVRTWSAASMPFAARTRAGCSGRTLARYFLRARIDGVTLTVHQKYEYSAQSQLTDAVYERIPQQILSLLRVGTPRYVIFAYGQSLNAADHSIVQTSLGGQIFGMCTNYQITGEVATRTVVRFEKPLRSPWLQSRGNLIVPSFAGAVIESYNVLPPE